MKYVKLLAIVLFSTVISFGCKEKASQPETEKVTPGPFVAPAQQNTATPNSATTDASQNAGGVWHYTCTKGCAGGAGTAVNCSTCGDLLVHNQAYHSNTNNSTTPTPFNPPPTEPSQNTAGVWHYTCGNGCAGGAGSAGSCGTCGSALAHNAAYHQ